MEEENNSEYLTDDFLFSDLQEKFKVKEQEEKKKDE